MAFSSSHATMRSRPALLVHPSGLAGHGERLVGEGASGEVLEGVEDQAVVLGPEPLLVDDAGRQRVGVPVAEGAEALLDRVDEPGVELAAVAPPELGEAHHVEVAGVLVRVDLGERRGVVVGGDLRAVEVVRPIATGSLEVGDEVCGAGRLEGARGVAEVVVLPGAPRPFVDEPVARAQRTAAARRPLARGDHRHQRHGGGHCRDRTSLHDRPLPLDAETLGDAGPSPRRAPGGWAVAPSAGR